MNSVNHKTVSSVLTDLINNDIEDIKFEKIDKDKFFEEFIEVVKDTNDIEITKYKTAIECYILEWIYFTGPMGKDKKYKKLTTIEFYRNTKKYMSDIMHFIEDRETLLVRNHFNESKYNDVVKSLLNFSANNPNYSESCPKFLQDNDLYSYRGFLNFFNLSRKKFRKLKFKYISSCRKYIVNGEDMM